MPSYGFYMCTLKDVPSSPAKQTAGFADYSVGDQTMSSTSSNAANLANLAARIFIALLFLIFGFDKLTHYSATVSYMAQTGAPFPPLSAAIASVAEFGLGIALILGVLTQPLAVALALYTLGASIIGHHFWTMSGLERYLNEINFFKNISVIGGLILLAATGAGRYSVDAMLRRKTI
jgi:putative oxidoreductase